MNAWPHIDTTLARQIILTASITVLVLVGFDPVCAQTRVYVSVAAEKMIAVYQLNDDDGTLLPLSKTKIPGEPGALSINPRQTYVFGSIRSEGRLMSLRVVDDGLRLVGTVPAKADPAHVATDRSGRYLFSAYYVAGKVAIHTIQHDGNLSAAGLWHATDEKAHAVEIDVNNEWLFVPHTGPNAIFRFRFDVVRGTLTAGDPPKVNRPSRTGPRHFAFHPNGRFAYCDNEQGSSVTAFEFDSNNGALRELHTLSTLPPGFSRPNSCARMEITQDGRFLYASNRGHDSIAGFTVDETTGRLTSLGQFPTEKTPRSFNVDPTGRFLIAAGEGSGKLATYRVQSDGRLSRLETHDVGKRPWWVLVAGPRN